MKRVVFYGPGNFTIYRYGKLLMGVFKSALAPNPSRSLANLSRRIKYILLTSFSYACLGCSRRLRFILGLSKILENYKIDYLHLGLS